MFDAGRQRSMEEEGRDLVERLGGRWSPRGGMCRCPAHGDRTPSLSVRPGRTRLLFHCFAGCDSGAILSALTTECLLAPGAPGWPEAKAGGPGEALAAAASRLWSCARPLTGTLGEDYLNARGLESVTELRFHPRTPHGARPLTRHRPALIAPVRDGSGLKGVQRTFLEGRGSRIAASGKCGLGPFGRGAVRLGGVARRLGLAEGIETALSASALFGVPCWASLGTERFASVELPAEVEELTLFLDNDEGGRRAEALAREAFAHLAIEARYPREQGCDWNDVLRRGRRPTA